MITEYERRLAGGFALILVAVWLPQLASTLGQVKIFRWLLRLAGLALIIYGLRQL